MRPACSGNGRVVPTQKIDRAGGLRRALMLATGCFGAMLCMCASASAAPSWLAPETISSTSQSSYEPRLAVDSQGDAVATWMSVGHEEIVLGSQRLAATGSWSGQEQIFEGAGAGFMGPEGSQVAIDSHGDAIALWESYNGSKYVVRASELPAGGSWQAPVELGESNEGGYPPQIAMDSAGDAIAVWAFNNGGHNVIEASELPAGGSWQAPVAISALNQDMFDPHIAMDSRGDAVAGWTFYNGSHQFVQTAQLPAGGSWQAPVEIAKGSEENAGLELAMDPEGDAVAVWVHYGSHEIVQASTMPAGGTWQATPASLSEGGQNAYEPRVAIDPAGDAVAVWQRYNGSHYVAQASELPAGGSWQSPEDLSSSGVDGYTPHVAMDSRGDAVAVWKSYSGSDFVQASELPAGGSWQSPVQISKTGQEAFEPQLAIDAGGDAVAVWLASENSKDVVQSADYVTSGPQLSEVSIPASGTVGETLSFSVEPLDTWTSLGQTSWSFGDGATATGASATHAYSAPGEYEVTVESADVLGNLTTEKQTLVVSQPSEAPKEEPPAKNEPATETTQSRPASAPEPKLSVLTKTAQPLINAYALKLDATCGPAACTVVARASVKLPGRHKRLHLRGFKGAIAAGVVSMVRLGVPARLRRAVRHYLVHHPHYRVKIELVAELVLGHHVERRLHINLPIWTYRKFR